MSTKIIFKYNENRNHAKSAMTAEFIYNLRASLETAPLPPNRVEVDIEGLVVDSTIPCLNSECEWIDYFCTFYPKLKIWSLPADGNHPRGHCEVCQGIHSGKIVRSDIQVLNGNQIKIRNK